MYRKIGFAALLMFSTATAAQAADNVSCIATQANVADALDAANKAFDRATAFVDTHKNLDGICSDQFASLVNETRQKLDVIEKVYHDGVSACRRQPDTMASLDGALKEAQTSKQSLDSTMADRETSCRDYHQ